MIFKPDFAIPAQEVAFPWKTVNPFHTQVFFNKVLVEVSSSVSDKHLHLDLDHNFDFNKKIDEEI